jgi:hypothetical protein
VSQSRRHSLIEAWVNILVGIGIQFYALHLMAPLLGFSMSWGQNTQVTAIMTVISLVRSYTLRRIFNRWHR